MLKNFNEQKRKMKWDESSCVVDCRKLSTDARGSVRVVILREFFVHAHCSSVASLMHVFRGVVRSSEKKYEGYCKEGTKYNAY